MLNLFDQVNSFRDLPETRVVSVEVCRGFSAVNDEELAASRIASRMGHAQYAEVVELVFTIQFAIDLIPRSTAANALWAAALGNKAWDDPVKLQPLIETILCELHEIRDGVRGVLFKKVHGHRSAVGGDFSLHAAKLGFLFFISVSEALCVRVLEG